MTRTRSRRKKAASSIILLDRTIPLGEPTITARRIAAAVINQLGPGDLGVRRLDQQRRGPEPDIGSVATAARAQESDLSTDISDEAKEIEAAFSH